MVPTQDTEKCDRFEKFSASIRKLASLTEFWHDNLPVSSGKFKPFGEDWLRPNSACQASIFYVTSDICEIPTEILSQP